jgi:hypothetical protein
MVRGARVPTMTVRLGWRDQLRPTTLMAAAHSDTDSGRRAFSGNGTHRQRGSDGKDEEQERRRGEKVADASYWDMDTAAASNSMAASHRARLRTGGGGAGA